MAASASERRHRRRRARVLAGLSLLSGLFSALLLVLVTAVPAHAHALPESQLWLDSRPDGLHLALRVPLNRLQYALHQPLADDPAAVLPAQRDALTAYLLAHLGLRSGAAGWTLQRPALRVVGSDASAELAAEFTALAPPGTDPRRATLLADPVLHEVRTHRLQVFLRQDWAGGEVGGAPRLLGTLEPGHTTLDLDLGLPSRGGFMSLLAAGAQHIGGGTDHLLFLGLLLMCAPWSARAGRWWAPRAPAGAAWSVLRLVSAFTLGHTLTLVGGSLGWLTPPVAPVELGVALSIVVAAVHAWRPLFGRAEWVVALGFGLLHGLAFSAALSGAGLTPVQHGLALLAFNLGIEAMQLLLAAALLPPWWLLSQARPDWAARLRSAVALCSAVLALAWVASRAGWWDLPGLDGDAGATAWWPAALGLWGLALWARQRPAAAPAT